MKKLLALILSLICLCSAALAEPETVDLEAMSLEELLALQTWVDEAVYAAYVSVPSEYAAVREQPAPIGATVRYDGSCYLNKAVTDLTVTDVVRGNAAWSKVYSWNSYNARPAEGMEYILISVRAAAIASEDSLPAEVYDYDFALISAAGVEYEYAYAADIPTELAPAYPGAQTEGWIVGLIEKGDEPLLVYLKDSDKPLWFDLSSYVPVELPEDAVLTELRRGDISEEVRTLLQALINLGYLAGTADGNFGRMTEEAVRACQAAMGLEETGVADPDTLRMILTGSKEE